ncbi:MAG: pyridoxamine 5'-phosphate oxidase family protein [Candidatus Methanoplasma sp.]|jgi:predicted pyridoxine 5'-phosphate oxidase superfamily flavin-nucleotide-binding protein|nr:pyridoxamine 5'-phosphate oxidase family protein [Candidatus Methanoplasma sp.]
MVSIPNNVQELIKAKTTTKVVVTSSKGAKPHAIVAGSIASPKADTMVVGEVLMKVSAKNLKENPKASFLIASGKDAFEIECTAKARLESGSEIDAMNKELAAIGLKAAAVWVFTVDAVYDQGASPKAGTKLA